MSEARRTGVLLHPTSLPGPYGIGDVGRGGARYLEFLAQAGVQVWQVLPLTPPGVANSPYSASSAFAGDTMLICPDQLVEDGLLDAARVPASTRSLGTIDWSHAVPAKRAALDAAFEEFKRGGRPTLQTAHDEFRHAEAYWLDDYALFASIKEHQSGRSWHTWPPALASREETALRDWRERHAASIERQAFGQFVFARQWKQLRERAKSLGIELFGDIPIYVHYDSADVWSRRDLFRLDARGRPTVVAGVPPDYFNADGQRWGNPIFDWNKLVETDFGWWVARVRRQLAEYDLVRLDHFRGFVQYWEVPASSKTAKDGRWVIGPGRALFDALQAALGSLPIVAEDLGDITPDVEALRDALEFPGMSILQFGFDPDLRSDFVPYRHRRNQVVYTGTHDNNTIKGWWRKETTPRVREFVAQYLGHRPKEIHWELIRLALASPAQLAVIPHQDLLGLGHEARMNTPGAKKKNWDWRLEEHGLDPQLAARLRRMNWVYGRSTSPA
jgi:4-alpha-glucanotransferase